MAEPNKLSGIGMIIALNDIHKSGSIRLMDTRRVQFDFGVIQHGYIPKLKDEVSVDAINSSNGLIASCLV